MKALLYQIKTVPRWLLLCSLLPLSTCSPKLDALEKAQALGKLVVATTNTQTTCYDGPDGLTGFECDLLQGLAKKMKVRLDLHFYDSTPETVDAVAAGKADLAAASINITPAREQRVRFSHPLQQVVLQMIYRGGATAPQNLGDVDEGELAVIPGSSAEELLASATARYPDLKWGKADPDNDVDDLLYQVSRGDLDYTIANSDVVAINQRYYPNLRVAFTASDRQDLAWALPRGEDDSLYKAVQDYLREMGEGELARVRDRYFGHINETDYLGVVRFTSDVQERLPRYRAWFEDAGRRYGLDWRVVAAIGYQESHWDPAAVSPTGVRGLMMLTSDTAALLEVDRENAAQSIRGAARYFQQIRGALPPQIAEPDRTWMALAAYNQGIGHLLDARTLAAELGGDPNRWLDVRNALPLLSRERWFKKTRYGYARGREAVGFVGNVRNYYDMLSWLTQKEGDSEAGRPAPEKAAATAAAATRVAAIRSADAPPRAR